MNPHLKQLWAAMRLPENFKKSYKFFCRGLDIRVAQVVETDTLHLVCYQKIREMLTQKVGPNPLSHRVYIDIVKIIGAIASAADLPILLLLFLHLFEHLLTGRDQGKRPAARLCFCLISCDLC